MAKRPSFADVHRDVSSKLRINPRVMADSVPQLTFSPSVGIIARDIDKLGMDIRSFREPLKRAVQQVIIPSIQRNFDEEGRPAWAPYAEATIDIREKMGEPVGNLLDKTGALRQVMSHVNIWTINNNAAILLDLPQNVWYGKVHQGGYGSTMGGRIKKTGSAGAAFNSLQKSIANAIKTGTTIRTGDFTIPARPFIMIQEEDVPNIQRVFEEWLEERIERHWSRHG